MPMSCTTTPDLDSGAKRLKTFTMKENIQPDFTTAAAVISQYSEPNSRSSLRTSSSSSSNLSSSRPNSHHRRRSSVSTRRESAEMMGLPASTLSELPTQDEADTDSVRRHALWALEGRFNNDIYSKVQIPELDTPDLDKKFELPLKNPFQFSNPMAGKRDSIGRVLTPSLSSKDQLHTLVEEEEEEEDQKDDCKVSEILPTPSNGKTTLRPLNLAPVVTSASIPVRNGLKPLTLATSPAVISPPGSISISRGCNSQMNVPMRRSSLSYKRSDDLSPSTTHMPLNLLPTPELTPVTAERPLSPSEQAFLSCNQGSLLSRISELERVLAVRTRTMSMGTASSRQLSMSSRQLSVSSDSSDGPSDEMLCLVRDLKMERDELVRDLSTRQTRIADLEKQITLLTQRVEKERCEVWQARQKLEALELDKASVTRDLASANLEVKGLHSALTIARQAEQQAITSLKAEHGHRLEAEREVKRLASMHSDRSQSIASSHSSATDVDLEASAVAMTLKTVPEDDERSNSDGEDELAHYEDEGDDDVGIYSDDSFSYNNAGASFFTLAPRSNNVLAVPSNLAAPLPSPSSASSSTPPVTPLSHPVVHARGSSLEQAWSFPRGSQTIVRRPQEIDRFFDCLELVEAPADSPATPLFGIDDRQDKYGFFSKFEDADVDDDPPFIIPANTGMVLEVVQEEEEEEDYIPHFGHPPSFWARQDQLTAREASPDVESSDECEVCPVSLRPKVIEQTVPLGMFHAEERISSSIDCATPKPSSFLSAVTSSPMLQTPRKPSSIPRLSPPSKRPSVSTFPPTPISNPRNNLSSNATRTPSKGRVLSIGSPNTPTRVVATGNNGLPMSPPAGSYTKSTAITTLASYLPWTAGWAPSPREHYSTSHTEEQAADSPLMASATSKTPSRPSATTVRKVPVTQMKKPERLFLL